MKKILIIAAIAIVTMMASCNKSKADNAKTEPKTVGDSISMYMGHIYGAEVVEMLDSTAVKDEFLAGVKEAINMTTDSLMNKGQEISNKVQTATGAEKGKLESRLGGMGFVAQYILPSFDYFKQMLKIDLNKEILVQSFTEAFNQKGYNTEADKKEFEAIIKRVAPDLQQQPQQQQPQVDPKQAEENAKAGAAYIEKEMKADKSLKRTKSGLVYKVIKEGKGEKPTKEQTVKVKYEGRHIDGTMFDNGNGQAIDFPVGAVVPGFAEGLMMMSPGAKYRLYIPGNIAYGERGTGNGGPIGPNETLVFDVELVEIVK